MLAVAGVADELDSLHWLKQASAACRLWLPMDLDNGVLAAGLSGKRDARSAVRLAEISDGLEAQVSHLWLDQLWGVGGG